MTKGDQKPPEPRNKAPKARSGPPSGSGSPPSRPSDSETQGRIFRIVRWVDTEKGAFVISRLISQTGADLRSFGLETKDDPRVLARLWPALDAMLTATERESLLRSVREGSGQG